MIELEKPLTQLQSFLSLKLLSGVLGSCDVVATKDYEIELNGVRIECDIEIETNDKKIELNGVQIDFGTIKFSQRI